MFDVLENSHFNTLLREGVAKIYSEFPDSLKSELVKRLIPMIAELSKVKVKVHNISLVDLGKTKRISLIVSDSALIKDEGVIVEGDPSSCLSEIDFIWLFIQEGEYVELMIFDTEKLSDFVAKRVKEIKEKDRVFYLGRTKLFGIGDDNKVFFKWPLLKSGLVAKRRLANLSKLRRGENKTLLDYLIEGIAASLSKSNKYVSAS